ncbi:MAG TPA: Ldh family oxidoreductase, partial [Beijerinckiaceae bacterium]|nr:Ldh family oxidoreductase [Beijerinckiaceae bacterium]
MDSVFVPAGALRAFAADLFAAAGLRRDHAATVAEVLVLANLRGVDTHGVFRVPTYLERIRAGTVALDTEPRARRVAHSALHVDGGDAMGAVVGRFAMGEAIALARETGLALVSVKRSGHYGMAAAYVLQAIEAGLVGVAFTNASPALPPWGGRAPLLGTSPLAVGVPAGTEHPFVLDMAMSVLARGNVYVAAQTGAALPPGLALDGEGRPTTDPRALIAGGTMLPFGGVKGAALSLLMDIFGGVLSGAAFAGAVGNPHKDFDRPQDVGHLFLAFRPDLFVSREDFLARMDHLVRTLKAQPRADGFGEILMPGERESRTRAERERTAIPLPPSVAEALDAEAARAGHEASGGPALRPGQGREAGASR